MSWTCPTRVLTWVELEAAVARAVRRVRAELVRRVRPEVERLVELRVLVRRVVVGSLAPVLLLVAMS
jgi:hypothetical protein